MNERWRQINAILGPALELEPEARAEFVRQACIGDAALLAEIDSLLSSYNSAGNLLEDSPAPHLFGSPMGASPGMSVGAYRIVREIGRGGMACVYLAERADQEYRKRVAIKMIKPAVNIEEMIRRFRNERQALAALDHPHIVKLLDGGTTEDGWPYLVMDFVEGLPINRYSDARTLLVRERLGLFLEVCAAIEYAHQHGVIHRDLKPSNILVTADGMVRLLDFGIAKLLDPQPYHTPEMITTGWRPMTPEYASPEQLRGLPVTHLTDIYSLGVLLYELLTGRRPHSGSQSTYQDLARSICDEEPPTPSQALHRTPGEVQRAELKGDLDTIVMKALSKEPERRYASAAEFSTDIIRHLGGRPVRARRPTLLYRGGKFLRRHKESVTAAALATAAMSGIILWQTHQMRVGRASQSSLVTRPTVLRPSVAILGFKDLANHGDTAWLSTALSETLATELGAGEKLRIVPGETVARAKVDLALLNAGGLAEDTLGRMRKALRSDFVVLGSYLDVRHGQQDELRVDLRIQDTRRGETIASLSETAPAERLTDLVARLGTRVRRQLGLAEPSRAEAESIQAAAPANAEAMKLYAQGLARMRAFDNLAATNLLTRSVAADPQFPLAHAALAAAWQSLGYDERAARESRQALALAARLSREERLLVEARSYEIAKDWQNAIEAYAALSRFFPDDLEYGLSLAGAKTGAAKGREALDTLAALAQSSAQAKDDPRIDLAISDAAASLADNQLRRDSAARAAAKAAAQGASLLVARARATECRALANLGENEPSRHACEEARRIYAQAGDRGGLARTLHSMAEVPLNQDDLDTAEALYRQALTIAREIGDRQAIGRELGNLGVIAKKRGDFRRARALYDEAYRNDLESGDKGAIAAVSGNLGNLLRLQGNLREAIEYYNTAMALSKAAGNKTATALGMSSIGETLAYQGELKQAIGMFRQALPLLNTAGEKGYYASTRVMLGGVLEQQGDLNSANRMFLEALSTQEQLKLKGDAAETQSARAEAACDAGRAAEGEALAREALGTFQSLGELDEELSVYTVLTRAVLDQGKTDQAQAMVKAALQISPRVPNVPVVLRFEANRAAVLAAANDLEAAGRIAAGALSQSHNLGLLRIELEAQLALAGIELKKGPAAAARTRLRDIEAAARRKGFTLIAQRAAAIQR